MPYLDVAGARLYFEVDGEPDRPAILLLHAGVATLRMWDDVVPALAREHRVIRFDARGFGRTESQNVDFSNRADALAVLDELEVLKATVIGASRGGAIALDLALEAPGRIRGVVTVGSGPSGFPEVELTEREDELFDALDAAFEAREWERLLRLETELWAIGPRRSADEVDASFLARAVALNLENLPHAEESPVPVPLEPPAYGRLSDIAAPALVVVGDHDITPALAQFEYLVTTLPNATGARFPGAAHLPSLEQHAEFERVLLDWLAEHGL